MANTDESNTELEIGTVEEACAVFAGTGRPLHPSTYYRLAKKGLVPAPQKIAPNISRVNLAEVRRMAREAMLGPASAEPGK